MVDRAICTSDQLVDGGLAVRFVVEISGQERPAFAVRYQGQVYAYLNECAHVPVEMDMNPGQFFDFSGQFLVCSMHGAYYAPDDGRCLGGPCHRSGLEPLSVYEADGSIMLVEEEHL